MQGRPAAEVSYSPSLCSFILLTHIAAAVLVGAMVLPQPMALLLYLGITGNAGWALACHGLCLHPSSIRRIQLRPENQCLLYYRNGDTVAGNLTADSLVSAPVTILVIRLTDRWRWRTLILLADNTDEDVYRRIRVWLRLSGTE